MDLARHLAGTLQDQLQKQRLDARDREQRTVDQLQEAYNRENAKQTCVSTAYLINPRLRGLHKTACIREKAAKLEIQFKHTPDSAAAAAVAAVEQAIVAHDVTGSSSSAVSADTLPVVSHRSTVNTLKNYFSTASAVNA